MKKLNELYPDVGFEANIRSIKINSKEVKKGDLFVCTKGVTADRHDFIDEAILNGASALVVSKDVRGKDVPIIKVSDTNREFPFLCQKFYDYPDQKMKMIGVTGTDGKTSVSTIIQTLIGSNICGYIGTNGRSCAAFKGDNPNTTPDADKLYAYLDEFIKFGCKYTVMEASSEAFFRGRLQSVLYDLSVYTNITKEHLNIHGSFENYLECKAQLFKQTKSDGYCVLNADDPYFEFMKNSCNGNMLTYGTKDNCSLQIIDYQIFPSKTTIHFKYRGEVIDVLSPLLGDFNVYNLAAGLLSCLALGFQLEDLLQNVSKIKVEGRLEMLDTNTPYYVMVDYAHTPNGISKLLNFVHTLDINRSIVVIGSAGERDYQKRPIMGKTVCDNATYAIFTYEDPRSEDPKDIIDMMIKNIKDTYTNFEVVIDRREAISKAIDMASDKDIVLILGKGNEAYQKLKDKTIDFNDIEEAYQAVARRNIRESVHS